MGRINAGRVILGGLLAGLVINIGEFVLHEVVLKAQETAAMAVFNLPPPSGSDIMWFVVGGFIAGVLTIWLYAAARPRLGAGAMTAVKIGLAVWVFSGLLAMMPPLLLGMMPAKVAWISIIWALVELPLAAVIGAVPYRES